MVQNVYPVMRRAVLPLLALSLVSNLAILISPIFMMQVLDRVIPSGNIATLALLGGVAFAALGLQALVEGARDLSLGRLARWAEREGTKMGLEPNRDNPNEVIQRVSGFSGFLSGPAGIATLSAPWIPIFLCVLWMLHPAFVGLLLVLTFGFFSLTLVANWLAHTSQKLVTDCAKREQGILRSAADAEKESGLAMLARNIRQGFAEVQHTRHQHADQNEFVTIGRTAIGGFFRNLGQIGALALGAWLVTLEQLSAGGMIAASILTSKTYAALEALSLHLPTIVSAKSDYGQLSKMSSLPGDAAQTVDIPTGGLRLENLIFPRGGGAMPRLDRIQFELPAGSCLAVIGNSGSGKTTLLQAMSGGAPAPIGSVFLGDHEIRSLSDASLFKMVGYLPQRPVFSAGTIAENISSFDPVSNPQKIIEAAKTAGVHGLICALADSYETDLGKQPFLLSAGQTQRVALARAIYSKPRYLFLDEPNALLDADGERALGQTLLRLKQDGVTIVMTVHRAGVLVLADQVLQLNQGRVADFGPKTEVLSRLGMGGKQLELPILQTSSSDLQDWLASQFTRAEDQPFSQKTRAIGLELLKIACANCPEDALLFSKFSFKFIDQTECELIMIEPFGNELDDIEGKPHSVLTTDGSSDPDTLVCLSKQDVGIASVTKMGKALEISSDETTTKYRVLISSLDRPALHSQESMAQ